MIKVLSDQLTTLTTRVDDIANNNRNDGNNRNNNNRNRN
ncbi:hypothetical protein A2U01_0068873, partial [Trifolium medium]|nr:hypothetical protein [Trifolium medium]